MVVPSSRCVNMLKSTAGLPGTASLTRSAAPGAVTLSGGRPLSAGCTSSAVSFRLRSRNSVLSRSSCASSNGSFTSSTCELHRVPAQSGRGPSVHTQFCTPVASIGQTPVVQHILLCFRAHERIRTRSSVEAMPMSHLNSHKASCVGEFVSLGPASLLAALPSSGTGRMASHAS